MKLLLLCIALLGSVVSGCGNSDSVFSSYSRGSKSLPGFPQADPVSGAYVVVPADQRVFQVHITSRQADLAAQLAELTAARDALHEAAKSVGDLMAFRVADPSLEGAYPREEKGDRNGHNALLAQVVFKQPTDPLKQMSDFVKAVGKIKPPAGAMWRISLNGSNCSLSSPEKYREQLVAKAMDGLKGLHSVDTSRFRVTVNGLERPLMVAQCSDTEFLVSLHYTIVVESVADKNEVKSEK
ncbi:MAG: SIMPL domain-containing protein [Verrucomicrobia bacterium]|nr:SIMPL domain-containing protein [Verrucomicrobiota bacterium]